MGYCFTLAAVHSCTFLSPNVVLFVRDVGWGTTLWCSRGQVTQPPVAIQQGPLHTVQSTMTSCLTETLSVSLTKDWQMPGKGHCTQQRLSLSGTFLVTSDWPHSISNSIETGLWPVFSMGRGDNIENVSMLIYKTIFFWLEDLISILQTKLQCYCSHSQRIEFSV